MSDIKARNAIIRCIQRLMVQRLWPSGYVDDKEPGGHLLLWSPKKAKAFRQNTVITRLWALGHDWIADDAYGGGMVSTHMRHIPIADLANILEWLLSIDIDAVAHRSKKDAA